MRKQQTENMKELFQDHKDNKVEAVIEKQVKKEIKLIGQQRKIPGLTLWEYNEKTKELQPAQYKKEDIVITALEIANPESVTKRNKVIVNENCVYFQALNRKNAIKKLKVSNA